VLSAELDGQHTAIRPILEQLANLESRMSSELEKFLEDASSGVYGKKLVLKSRDAT
jgi:hypothetical protein